MEHLMDARASRPGGRLTAWSASLLALLLIATAAPASQAAPQVQVQQSLSQVGFKLESLVPGDIAGIGLAVGDFDGDGVLDLAVGAACDDTAAPGAGATYILYGPITPGRSLAEADAVLQGTNGAFAGEFLTALDMDGDGAHELVVGAPGPVVGLGPLVDDCYLLVGALPAHPGFNQPGEAYLFRGGQRLSGALSAREAADTVITGYAPTDFAGWDVAGADLDGDGRDELVVGAPGLAGLTGAAFLFEGNDLPGTARALDADAHVLGEEPMDMFGTHIAAGDLDGDGIDDLVIGIASLAGRTGHVYVFLGGTLPSGVVTASSADIVIRGDGTDDGTGYGLAVADLDGDGANDLIVSAPWANMTYVFYGPIDRRGTLSVADADVSISGGELRAAGVAVAVGNLDGDDRADLFIGASRDDTGGERAGAVHRLTGPLVGDVDATNTGFLLSGEAFEQAGLSLAVGDVTGDGLDDLIVGAPALFLAGTDDRQPGAVYIVGGDAVPDEQFDGGRPPHRGEARRRPR